MYKDAGTSESLENKLAAPKTPWQYLASPPYFYPPMM